MVVDRAREILGAVLAKMFGSANGKTLRRAEPYVAAVHAYEPETMELSDAELVGKTAEFKKRLADGETLDELLPDPGWFSYVVDQELTPAEIVNRAFQYRPIEL